MTIDPAIEAYYSSGTEGARVFPKGKPSLEYTRIVELLDRLLPSPPGKILDVGGGPGTYAIPLLSRGYQVRLIEPVTALAVQAARDGVDAIIGDACDLDAPDGSCDAVLLFGPLYHLTERKDRRRALSEAGRVLKPGGTLLATMISRYGTMLCGLYERQLENPVVKAIVAQDLATGQHRNPTGDWRFFTTAYFDTPEGLSREIDRAGFNDVTVYGVEGPGWVLPDWADHKEAVLAAARTAERQPSLIGFSLNFLAKAIK
jgi:SAM-dependent methyltransferase